MASPSVFLALLISACVLAVVTATFDSVVESPPAPALRGVRSMHLAVTEDPFTPSNPGSKRVKEFWGAFMPAVSDSIHWLNSTSLQNASVFNSDRGAIGMAMLVFNPLLMMEQGADSAQQAVQYEKDLFSNHIMAKFRDIDFAPKSNERQKFCCFARRAVYSQIAHGVTNSWVTEFEPSDRSKALSYVQSFPKVLGRLPAVTIEAWAAKLLPQFASLLEDANTLHAKAMSDKTKLEQLTQFFNMTDRALNSTDNLYWFCESAEVATLTDLAEFAVHNDLL